MECQKLQQQKTVECNKAQKNQLFTTLLKRYSINDNLKETHFIKKVCSLFLSINDFYRFPYHRNTFDVSN